MVTFDNLTKSFHKHMYDTIMPTYYCHFSKLSVGDAFTEKLWVIPIWSIIPRYIKCANMIDVTLRCHSIIDDDHLLTELRKMADFCVNIYSKDWSDPVTPLNKFTLYNWVDATLGDPLSIAQAETFVSEIIELPIAPSDTVAAINISIKILVCC